MLFTTLRGLVIITCQTFKPLNQSFRQNTHFQNGAPFIFDKVFITNLRMLITEQLPLCGPANILLKATDCRRRREKTAASGDCYFRQLLKLPFPFHCPQIMWNFFYLWKKVEKIVEELGISNYREKCVCEKAINILFTLLSRYSLSDIYYTAAIYIFNHCPLIDAVKYF